MDTTHHNEQLIRKYREAVLNKDFSTLATLSKHQLEETFVSTCMCGCREDVSVMSLLQNCVEVNPEVISFLLEQGLLTSRSGTKLLYKWLINANDDWAGKINVLLQWATEQWKEEVLSYADHEYHTTLLHAAIYGYSNRGEPWIIKLIKTGCNPFAEDTREQTPFMCMLSNANDRAVDLVAEMYPDKIDVNKCEKEENAGVCDDKYWTGRDNMQRLLHKYRNVKSENILQSVRRVFKFMLTHGIDLNHEDRDGMNAANYLWHYKWMDVLGPELTEVNLPIPRNARPVRRMTEAYKYMNPSPFAFALYEHRYDKTVDNVLPKIRKLVEQFGAPTRENANASGVGSRDERGIEFRSLVDLVHSWNFHHTEVNQILNIQ